MNDPIAIAALVLSGVSLVMACVATMLWIANRLSTHRIEWRTIDMKDAQDTNTLTKKLNEQYDDNELDML